MEGLRRKNCRPFVWLPPDGILPNPARPRRNFDGDALLSLAESIRENGLLQPLTVRKAGSGYMLIAGERRLRAARMAGLHKIPCAVVKADDRTAAVMALAENWQREELDCFEVAEGLFNLIHLWGVPREDAAARLGVPLSALADKLRLLKLTPCQREQIRAARLTERHARALLRVEESTRNDALTEMIARALTGIDSVSPAADPPHTARETLPCRKAVVGDLRLCANTVARAVSAMQQSGVDARAEKTEDDRTVQYRILIAKPPADDPGRSWSRPE